ncbi:hypothetical protein V8F20_009871 [Naviculisporaceae sp. PSN 640]
MGFYSDEDHGGATRARPVNVICSDHRGYTPVPLRWWYLSSVLGYIILLLAILEYSFHVIPQTIGRQTTPPTYFNVPPGGETFNGNIHKASVSRLSPQAHPVIRRNTTSPFPANSTSTPNPCDLDFLESLQKNQTSTSHANETCTVSTADPREPSTFRILHLSPSQFASLSPRTYLAHYRLHFIWVHDTTGRLYIPVFPGMDISTRCTYYGQYQYITTNPDDCRMLVEVDDFGIPGYQPLFANGDRCYKEWYTFTEQYAGQWGWQPDISGNDWDKSKCWEDEWDRGEIIHYPSRVVSWPAGWPTGTGTGNVGVVGDMPIPVPTKTTVISTLPPTMSLVTSTSIGVDGKPTTSVFTTAIPGRVITSLIDVTPTPTARITVDGTVLTLTNSLGQPTATITSLLTSGVPGIVLPSPTPYVSFSTTILTGSDGRPTATSVIPVTITPTGGGFPLSGISKTIHTFYNQFSSPIATSTGYILPLAPHPSPANVPIAPEDLFAPGGGIGTGGGGILNPSDIPSQAIQVQPLTWQSYFVGSFLPVLLTTILSILVQILNGSLRNMVPFLALSRESRPRSSEGTYGASASDSLLLPLDGNIFRLDTAVLLAWRHKEPLLLMSTLLQIKGMVLASLSSEAIGMTLGGGCREDSFQGCFMSLAVVTGPARAAEGLLVGMALLLVGIMAGIWFLGRRRTMTEGRGLLTTPGGTNPTSIFAAAAMIAGEESKSLRELLGGFGRGDREVERISDKEIRDRLEGHEFAMNSHGQVILATQGSSPERSRTGLTATSSFSTSSHTISKTKRRITDLIENKYDTFTSRHRNMVLIAEYAYRALFLAALGTLLFIVAYYGSAQHGADDLIERFMNSQTFGVSFLFTGAGGLIDFFWGGFFSRTELLEPYRYLSQPEASISPARSSANMARPRSSSIFSGLFRAVINNNVFLSAVAFAGVLSKFLPVVLSNVPFRLTLTWDTYVICTWISVSVLAVMILVMIASFFVKRPDLPVDAETIAGRMYYVCDSWVTIAGREDTWAGHLAPDTRYRFGKIVGASGRERIGIDFVPGEKHV